MRPMPRFSVTRMLVWLAAGLTVVAGDPSLSNAAERFTFRQHDRVVLIGGTFIERMQQDSHLEALLTLENTGKQLTFRNLGWSGDTVWGESRALFGTQQDGFARLVKDVRDARPTVLMVSYGGNEAYAGLAGIERFREGLAKLLNELQPPDVRLILIAPPPRMRPSPRLPDPEPYNQVLQQYAEILAAEAHGREAGFINLAGAPFRQSLSLVDYEADGIQLSAQGHRRCAEAIGEALGVTARLPADGVPALRQAIHDKNVLYFHRYRPQNETYLFLFRKHEQGNNAVEIPQFDPLVAEKENLIAQLCERLRSSTP